MKEPFNLTMDQIGQLTDEQILRIYARRDDAAEEPAVPPPAEMTDDEAAEATVGALQAMFGMTEQAARAYVEKQRAARPVEA